MRRLRSFSYVEPTTLEEASRFLSDHGDRACLLAGGTDLLVRMKRREIAPSVLINLKRIPGLNEIELEPGKGTSIGALSTVSALEQSSVIRNGHGVLADAAHLLGTPSVRTLATLGGNIGRASPASDLVPSLIVLGAMVRIEGPHGSREVQIEDLFSGPGITTLKPGEFIVSCRLPERPPRSGAAYLKLGRREGSDCALVGVAVSVVRTGNDQEVGEARVALSSVAPVPLRARRTEVILRSGPLLEKRLIEASETAAEEASPIDDLRATGSYRKEMVRVLTYKAISRALELAEREDVNH